ncbi:fluoride efflux transporter CrcB [Zavarzinia compransoris]|uniref:Fluoride-specific ion channel FluC n=1 Tax=Zavarzinia compransoris TaxID=1264899 RepID=A0A317DTL0_9PROT|nr:fluoride efflux transporter CrcB [Zavarzinia compransoris]PWR18009.1 fluoride efflux transporter CrcB [Zavarzinia compransoris]TDP43526.1 camphor resistance protein CrcB [Zavarzinia compransoris]
MGPYVLVAVGGAAGSVLRLAVARLAQAALGAGFPYGTLAVNLSGSLVMGALAALFAARAGDDPARLFLMTGVLGGFTTFSAFSLDAYGLWARGEAGAAALYVAASVVLSIGALVVGFWLVRQVVAS